MRILWQLPLASLIHFAEQSYGFDHGWLGFRIALQFNCLQQGWRKLTQVVISLRYLVEDVAVFVSQPFIYL